MGLLGYLGHVALGALDMAARYADKARERKKAANKPTPEEESPRTEPYATPASAPEVAAAAPEPTQPRGLGNPDVAVQVFGRMSCSFTHRARRLLEDRAIEYAFTELDAPEGLGLVPKLRAPANARFRTSTFEDVSSAALIGSTRSIGLVCSTT